MKDPVELLSQIQQVEAPPFLFTRIQQKIKEAEENRLSPKWAWTLGIAVLLFMTLNIAVFSLNSRENKHNYEQEMAQSFQLLPNNTLYK